MMLVVYVSVLLVLFASIVSTQSGQGPYEMEVWNKDDQPLWEQLSTLQEEMESLRREQAILKHKQKALDQMLIIDENVTSLKQSGRPQLFSPPHLWLNEGDEDDEGDGIPNYDPCFRYSILDQAWRATNYTTKSVKCDRQVRWQGWYRLYYRGKSIQMPEKCIPENHCGTHSPLWLTQPHPNIRDGVVTRKMCGNWKKKCCAFQSNPIQVKACRGNYYVYRLVRPTACHLAYCADVNTLVCGRCSSNQYCTSRDRITYRCAARKKKIKKQVIHFFASYPGSLKGKVNRIRFSKVLVNVGAGFNKQTGVFRAPVSGVYQFYFSSQSGGSGGNATNLWLVINGYWVSVSRSDVKTSASIGSLSTYMTTLRKGAQVYVTHVTGQSWADSASNTITFGGSLLMQRRLK
ncbi:uncharacterized protein LOC121699930 [Alosa sapidissima]|uniref:uncharacterized protein LOC121699930 n=1 Tax=Alosa sapidissima TaxID=34773 RepID=UPI001C07F72F|nr:uncharacterized protein LOC121699930 [Alosa sapidissima]